MATARAAREDNKQPERSTTKELSYLDALEHEADGLSGCRRWADEEDPRK